MFSIRKSLAFMIDSTRSKRAPKHRLREGGRLRMEALEDRRVLATFTVTNVLDSGAGSFRDAITQANSTVGVDTIAFNIAGPGVKTISPASAFPNITEGVVIDGTTQPGYTASPLIEIDGSNAGAASGLRLSAGSSTVRALVINDFQLNGIELVSGGNTVDRSIIGLNPAGTVSLPNLLDGIAITSSNNTIGGTAAGAGNFISGNGRHGIVISSATATGNTVAGNSIGLAFNNASKIPNQGSGVVIINAASGNTVGGFVAGARNLISGNRANGVQIEGTGTNNNAVHGNFIGNGNGTTTGVGNSVHGILITRGARNNRVGTGSANGQNIISGNSGSGIKLKDTGTIGNVVIGNRIGTNAAGTGPLANAMDGITIETGASSNNIGINSVTGTGNLISGNLRHGILISDAGSSANVIRGNSIGLDASGAVLGNTQSGIQVQAASTNNVIGGTNLGTGNHIGGNLTGILFKDAGTTGNLIQGNFIGIDSTGALARANRSDGVAIEASATMNTVGGSIAGSGNLIGGNTRAGVRITGVGTSGNLVLGNTVGLNVTGSGSVPNAFGVWVGAGATSNVVGGLTAATRNTISGNTLYGVLITGTGTSNNTFFGSFIGLDPNGLVARPNGFDGIFVSAGASGNTIGGAAAGAVNHISGNTRNGIRIHGVGTNNNAIRGNVIGLNGAQNAIPNGQEGVMILLGASGTLVGDSFAGAGNVISGNGRAGVRLFGNGTQASVSGNRIGTNSAGTGARPNTTAGVRVENDATATIGGTTSGAANVISANTGNGVELNHVSSVAVVGNLIGTDLAGTSSLGNGVSGVRIENGSLNNIIGGSNASSRNIISGNLSRGVHIKDASSEMNVVSGNYIGTDITGSNPLANGTGVAIESAKSNFIGGTGAGARNVISGNTEAGILLQSDNTSSGANDNMILGNYIGINAGGTIAIPNQDGIVVNNLATDSILGGTMAGAANVISGNLRFGVSLSNVTEIAIHGNLIGVLPDGTTAAGNGSHGIFAFNNASLNDIGGSDANSGNVIANSTGNGVLVGSDPTLTGAFLLPAGGGNSILRNRIFANSLRAIDLGPNDGATANDSNDPDVGPNALQNKPLLTLATSDGTTAVISGSLNSLENANYRFEFFAGANQDQAERFLGSSEESIAAGVNNVSFAVALDAGIMAGEFVTATATNLLTGDTSELSLSILVI
jgi:hypothetical protein